jgi:UDP-N-acetylglucosamine 2-epimerase
LNQLGVRFKPHVKLIEPVGYFDIITLEDNARLIATDSGGVQREAYFLGIPCLTLRDETEWSETVTAGWNKLVGADPAPVLAAWFSFAPPADRPPIFGDGTTGQRIVQILEENLTTFGWSRGSSQDNGRLVATAEMRIKS